jgi:hypothetical protein
MLRIAGKIVVGALTVFFLFAAAYVPHLEARSVDPTQAEDQSEWNKDMGKKLDTAIGVLSIIKDELKDEDKSRAAVDATSADQDEAMAQNLARWIGKINRIWRNITKVTASQEDGAPARDDADSEQDVVDTKAISSKLGTAMEMMSAIKKELDKQQKEETEEK